jgi:putative DNA base modification enzyme with NMAD domain
VAAFVANVGVNSSHSARSPLTKDGRFCLLPIPERHAWRPPMLRLDDLPHLAVHAPATWGRRVVHFDPDLTSAVPTYGDNCRRAGRAFSLRRARAGDLIVFLARLQPDRGPAGFFLVGSLEVLDVLADVERDPGRGWWDTNAHVRRARATGAWDSFWVFRGTQRSSLLPRAVPFQKQTAAAVFGDTWRWPETRTELQTIGSYTRAVRRVEEAGEIWLRTTCLS